MAKGKKGNRGRPKMSEAEKAAAKIGRATPNMRVVERQDRFRPFHGDSSIGHEMSCAGRLMLVGAFDGLDATPEEALSALLAYAHGYWGNYVDCLPQLSDYQREVKGGNDNAEEDEHGRAIDKRGEWFADYDQRLRDCGHATVQAVHNITVDTHWFPDDDATWASRIVNSRVLDKRLEFRKAGRPLDGLTICGGLATDSDWAMLELARAGAMALAHGKVLQRAA